MLTKMKRKNKQSKKTEKLTTLAQQSHIANLQYSFFNYSFMGYIILNINQIVWYASFIISVFNSARAQFATLE